MATASEAAGVQKPQVSPAILQGLYPRDADPKEWKIQLSRSAVLQTTPIDRCHRFIKSRPIVRTSVRSWSDPINWTERLKMHIVILCPPLSGPTG